MLYEVALVQKPTKKESEEGQMEKLILGPICVVSKDDKQAGVIAVMQNKEKITGDLQNVEVLVRPF